MPPRAQSDMHTRFNAVLLQKPKRRNSGYGLAGDLARTTESMSHLPEVTAGSGFTPGAAGPNLHLTNNSSKNKHMFTISPTSMTSTSLTSENKITLKARLSRIASNDGEPEEPEDVVAVLPNCTNCCSFFQVFLPPFSVLTRSVHWYSRPRPCLHAHFNVRHLRVGISFYKIY